MCKTHPDKTLDPTPFFSTERSISGRSGFGMRLARIPYSSARHPYSALCPPPLTGVARGGAGRGSPFTWLLGHARRCGLIPGALRSSCMSSALSPSLPRGVSEGRACAMLLCGPCEAGTPLVSWGSCAPTPQERSFSYNTLYTYIYNPQHATTKAETEKQGEQKGIGICNAKRGRSVYQCVLCIDTEPSANAGGEVRSDLEDGVFVA
jgi:hypothetical protein